MEITKPQHNPKRAFKAAVSPRTRRVIDAQVNADRKARVAERAELITDKRVQYAPPVRAAHPWEQQAHETDEAYLAFKLYRDLGLGRTITAVAAEMGRTDCGAWPRKWSWQQRAKLWDAEQEAQDLEAQRLARREMIKRQTRLGIRMQEVATDKLEKLTDPEITLPAADVARLAKEGVTIERLAQGESTTNNANAIQLIWNGPPPSWAPANLLPPADES